MPDDQSALPARIISQQELSRGIIDPEGMLLPAQITRRRLLGSVPVLSGIAASLPKLNGQRSDAAVTVYAPGPIDVRSATLFAFDDVSIPFRENLFVKMCSAEKYPGNPVLKHGTPGQPDEYCAKFYGSIIRHEGRFKMWYVAGDSDGRKAASRRPHSYYGWRPAYAESQDGIHWTKPNLGLVEYKGSRNNNLVLVDPPEVMGLQLIVLHEPNDPDPARRFKMMVSAAWAKGHTSVPLFSADGLRWHTPRKVTPIDYRIQPEEFFVPVEHFEQSGLYKWQGMYCMTGQQIDPWVWLPDGQLSGRAMTILHSRDFIHWPAAKTLAFTRYGYRPRPVGQGEEAHLPASIWHRDNVLLGIYGQWHGAVRTEDRSVDLGLLISNDGYHFREPLPDFVFLPHGPKGVWDSRALLQGQAFEHIGDRTHIWYGSSSLFTGSAEESSTQVGLATLRRDGFGYLSVRHPAAPASLTTCALRLRKGGKLSVNADGLSAESWLDVELLDEREIPIPAYSGENCIAARRPGFNQPVSWKKTDWVDAAQPVRIRVRFQGNRRDSIRLYAIYVG